ncbi:MAG: DUF3416 domain-containing protein [Siphonobacter sp.]
MSIPFYGQQRVLITNVQPTSDQYVTKAIVGDWFHVEVDLLVDGNDKPLGRLLYRHEHTEEWSERSLYDMGNDRFGGDFLLDQQGYYEYTFEAWVNHALTWQQDVYSKATEFQNIPSELLAGKKMLEEMAVLARKEDQTALYGAALLLGDPNRYHEAITLALSQQMLDWVNEYPIKSYITVYRETMSLYADRGKAAFSSWYTLFPRSTASEPGQHGTLKNLQAILPRIAEMGFDVLHIPPIHPIGHLFRKGKNNATIAHENDPGSPYAIGNESGGHDSIHPELGTVEDFKTLIQVAKELGIEIAMDLAIQFSPDHPWVKQHPDWFQIRPDGSFQYSENPPHKYQDSCQLNFETDDWQNLWEELKQIVFLWASWGIRIMRVDQPHGKPFVFWKWLIWETKKHFPDMIFLAEAFTHPKIMQELSRLGFTQSYTYYIWRNSKAELTEYMTELTQTELRYYFRPNFWPNTHDVNPYSLQTGLEPLSIIRYFLAATLTSNYGIYGPIFEHMIHEAYPGREEYLNSEKYEIRHWDWSRETKLTILIRLINRIRRENTALQRTNNITFVNIPNDALMGYLKIHPNGNRLLCIVNLDPHYRQSAGVQIPLHLIGKNASEPFFVHDLLTDNRWQWQGEWNYVELDPAILPVHLFRIEDIH